MLHYREIEESRNGPAFRGTDGRFTIMDSIHESVAVPATARKSLVTDVPHIKNLIDSAVGRGALLPRPLAEIYETVRDFHVVENGDGLGGCCALHVDLADLAEIRSLVVREELRGKHLGAVLVNACLEEARRLGISRVYALTRVAGFFTKCGFHEIDKHDLPSKVFRDCVRCPSFPDCDEVAMMHYMDLPGESTAATGEE